MIKILKGMLKFELLLISSKSRKDTLVTTGKFSEICYKTVQIFKTKGHSELGSCCFILRNCTSVVLVGPVLDKGTLETYVLSHINSYNTSFQFDENLRHNIYNTDICICIRKHKDRQTEEKGQGL